MEAWFMDKQVDVVIVGAGPVGLLLAIELKLGGAHVIVLERLAAPSRDVKGTSVGPLGAEALQRRGMGLALAEAEDRCSRKWRRATASCSTRLPRSSWPISQP